MNPNQLPRCLDDVQTVDSATNEAFTVKVNFSEHCNAAWGKVERIDGRGLGNTIGIRIYPAAAPADSTTAQRTSDRKPPQRSPRSSCAPTPPNASAWKAPSPTAHARSPPPGPCVCDLRGPRRRSRSRVRRAWPEHLAPRS
ncbi:DUF2690 domain-containing protein [Gordonia amicalis]|uniref:DUF2690 domain-containing protein n=1 Tax=Gordonia amicalis TaxID=89053 RepID=UPI0037BFC1AF